MSLPVSDTFPRLIAARLREAPGRPLVTAYDDASGERTELSVATYANWVAKTANLLIDEYLLDTGDTIRIALPPHWLTTVFLGAAWSAGIAVTTDAAVPAGLLITGPDLPADHHGPVLACSLLPFAVRFPEPLPGGVDDYGLLWPAQPDVFVGAEPMPGTIACRHGDDGHSQQELLALARASADTWTGDRLLTDVDPTERCSTTTWLASVVTGGSLVLVSHPDESRWPARQQDERATDVLRSDP